MSCDILQIPSSSQNLDGKFHTTSLAMRTPNKLFLMGMKSGEVMRQTSGIKLADNKSDSHSRPFLGTPERISLVSCSLSGRLQRTFVHLDSWRLYIRYMPTWALSRI